MDHSESFPHSEVNPSEPTPHLDVPDVEAPFLEAPHVEAPPFEVPSIEAADHGTPAVEDHGKESANGAPALAPAVPATIPTEWLAFGFIDDDGNIQRRETSRLAGAVLGQVKGRNPYAAMRLYVDRFKKLEERVNTLQKEFDASENKGRFSERSARLVEAIRLGDGLGDFDTLLARVEGLSGAVIAFQAEQKGKKEELIAQADTLRTSTDWQKTADKLKSLQEAWKKLGTAGRDDDESLWQHFRAHLDEFFHHRDEARKVQNEQRDAARIIKQAICEAAELLETSTDWDAASAQFDEMMERWKAAGWSGKDLEDILWERFRSARARFFDKRRGHFNGLKAERDHNVDKKEELIAQAEALIGSEDIGAAMDRARQLQADWKAVGPVPRAKSDVLWGRFKGACDQIFQRGHAERAERGRRRPEGGAGSGKSGGAPRQEVYTRKREQAESMRESISRDLRQLNVWRQALSGLRPGGNADALREKYDPQINDLAQRLESKKEKLAELEKEISQLQSAPEVREKRG